MTEEPSREQAKAAGACVEGRSRAGVALAARAECLRRWCVGHTMVGESCCVLLFGSSFWLPGVQAHTYMHIAVSANMFIASAK